MDRMVSVAVGATGAIMLTVLGVHAMITERPLPRSRTRSVHRPRLHGLGQLFLGLMFACTALPTVLPAYIGATTDWSFPVNRILFALMTLSLVTSGVLMYGSRIPRRPPET
jgi:cytochrome c biogenesis protein CcdA